VLVLMSTISQVRTYMTQAQANKILVHKDLYAYACVYAHALMSNEITIKCNIRIRALLNSLNSMTFCNLFPLTSYYFPLSILVKNQIRTKTIAVSQKQPEHFYYPQNLIKIKIIFNDFPWQWTKFHDFQGLENALVYEIPRFSIFHDPYLRICKGCILQAINVKPEIK